MKRIRRSGLNGRKMAMKKHVAGMKKFEVYCTSCGELLASFYNTKPELDENVHEFHYHLQFNRKFTYGCYGINVNPDNGEVRFECCCGNRELVEKQTLYGDARALKTPDGAKIVGGKPIGSGKLRYTSIEIKNG